MEDFYSVDNNVGQQQLNAIDPRYLVQDTSNFVDYRNINVYQLMLEMYKGEGGFKDGSYLVPFQRETFYADRCMTACYKNFFKPIINAMIDPVFETEVERETDNELFAEFCKNVDSCGTSLTDFTSTVMINSRVCGFSFVVIDNYNDVQNLNYKEAIKQRRYPYMYEITPDQLHNLETDIIGKVTAISFNYGTEELANNKKVEKYIEWNANSSIVYYYGKDKEKIVIDERLHNLGKIPVIISNYFIKDKKFKELPNPIYYDIAMLNFSLYQKETYVQELEKYQTFSLLVCQGIDPKQLSVGPSNFINVADNVSNLPTYISPNTDNTRVLMENCAKLKEEIYQQAGQKGVFAVKEQLSGTAKEWDFRSEESVLKATSKAASQFEIDVADIFGRYINTKVTVETKYPEDFSPQYYDTRVKEILEILKNNPPQALAKALWEEISSIVYKQTPDKAEEIIKEIVDEFATENNMNEDDLNIIGGDKEDEKEDEKE